MTGPPAPAPAAPVPPRKATWIRLVLAPAILGVSVAILALHDRTGNPLPTDLLMALFGGAATLEMCLMLKGVAPGTRVGIPLAAGLLLSGIGVLAPEDASLRGDLRGMLVAGTLVLLMLAHLRDVRRDAVASIAASLLPVVYVGLLFSFTRETADGPEGARRLIWVVVTAKASDMGGWAVGKPFGRHKLIPSVSPGKTWEGLAGGLAASVLAAVLLPPALSLSEAGLGAGRLVLFGLVVGGAATLAGVTQSGWKRRVGVKDSSRLIPEMGGVLDMLDSILLAGPAAWAFLALT